MAAEEQPCILFHAPEPHEVIRIGPDGRIWWNSVEIATEQEFKEAMSELARILTESVVANEELTSLRQVCRNTYEVWAGSEGIPEPETAAEAYLLSLVEQMRDEVKKGL